MFKEYMQGIFLSMPMTLYLYNSNDDGSIENVFSWEPTTKQWWITGFNPEYAGEVDVHDLTMVGCIDMSGNEELFNYFVKRCQNINIDNHSDWQNVYIDETSHCFWICWGDQS